MKELFFFKQKQNEVSLSNTLLFAKIVSTCAQNEEENRGLTAKYFEQLLGKTNDFVKIELGISNSG